MDYQEILVQEYKAYLESKDRFVERSFLVNRFYLVIVFGLMLWLFSQIDHVLGGNVSLMIIIIAALGMASSLLWVLNQDAYAYLIRIKLGTVLEKFEQQLPLQPHNMEYEAIKARNESGRKRVMFVDIQKGVGMMCFFTFFTVFLYSTGLKLCEYIVSAAS